MDDVHRKGLQPQPRIDGAVNSSRLGQDRRQSRHQNGPLGRADNGGANVSKFCNQAYDGLVTQARRIANPALRIPLYEEAQRIFKQHAPWLPLSHSTQTWVHRQEVRNFRMSPFGGLDFYGVELK